MLLLLGLERPILELEKFWIFENRVSMWSGMISLFDEGELLLGTVVLVFAVVFPICKNLLVLAILYGVRLTRRHADNILHWLALLGKWSMLDVFIVAILVTSVKLGALAQAHTGPGLYFFLVSVLLTNSVSTWLDWKHPFIDRSGGRDA